MNVLDTTTGQHVGTVASHSLINNTLTAQSAFSANYRAAFMPPNPGWAVAGLTVTDVTTGGNLGALQVYGPYSTTLFLTAGISIGDTTLHMVFTNDGLIIPGML